MSLCVTELKNNVAAYLDNLEVSRLQLIMGGAGLGSLGRRRAGPIDKLAKVPAAGTKWKRSSLSCRPEAGPGAGTPQPTGHRQGQLLSPLSCQGLGFQLGRIKIHWGQSSQKNPVRLAPRAGRGAK